MYVGFNNGWGQGGLNEKGLAYDWVAGYLSDYNPSSNLQKVLGNPSHRMLETCATVDEAILFYQKYREPSFSFAKLFIADTSGNSIIIQANSGTLEFLKTNKSRVLGYGEHTFNQLLSENSSVELSSAKNILSSCIQTGKYGTKYSTVYDLKTKDIYVYSNANFENVCILNLEDELKKSTHYYEIPHIKEQVLQSVKPLRIIMKRNIILFFLIQHWWICLLVFLVLGVGIVAVKRQRCQPITSGFAR
jgi:penicillin V acylase-like amidase (Ntn superfamily)